MKTITWHKSLFLFLLALTINHCRTSPILQPTTDSPDLSNPPSMASIPPNQAPSSFLDSPSSNNPDNRWEQTSLTVTEEQSNPVPGVSARIIRDDPDFFFDSAYTPTQPGQKSLAINSIER